MDGFVSKSGDFPDLSSSSSNNQGYQVAAPEIRYSTALIRTRPPPLPLGVGATQRRPKQVTGRLGEKQAYEWFKNEWPEKNIDWVNVEEESTKHYDLTARDDQGRLEYIEVKATSNSQHNNDTSFHMSSVQYLFAEQKADDHIVAMVFLLKDDDYKLRYFRNVPLMVKRGQIIRKISNQYSYEFFFVNLESVKASLTDHTIEVEVTLTDKRKAKAALPRHDTSSSDCAYVNEVIGRQLVGQDPLDQTQVDKWISEYYEGLRNNWGFPLKRKIPCGPDAILAVSIANCRVGAMILGIPMYKYIAHLSKNTELVLPRPALRVFDAGSQNKHAFTILPTGASSFKQAIKMGVEVYNNLKKIMPEAEKATTDGAQAMETEKMCRPEAPKDRLELLKTANDTAQYTGQVLFEMTVNSISQDDWEDLTTKMFKVYGQHMRIVRHDPLVSNPQSIPKSADNKSFNAHHLKVNQFKCVSDCYTAVKKYQGGGGRVIADHCVGETDTFIADLAVGLGMVQIETEAEGVANNCQILRLQKIEDSLEAQKAGSLLSQAKPGTLLG